MLVLLRIVNTINKGKIEDDIPPLLGGSSEVHQVYSCFSKLYRIVRISNVAFFSGNLPFAYRYDLGMNRHFYLRFPLLTDMCHHFFQHHL